MPTKGKSNKKSARRGRSSGNLSGGIYGGNDFSMSPSHWPAAGPSGGIAEYKNVDTTINSQVSTTSVITLLNGLAPGTTASTRIGRKVSVRRIDYVLSLASSTTGIQDHICIAVVEDRQPNGGTFNTTDYLTGSSSRVLPNANEFARFRTIVRYDVTLAGSSVASGPPSTVPSAIEQLPVTIPVHYNAGTAGTISDIQTNALYLFVIGDGASNATNPFVYGQVRLWYTDS